MMPSELESARAALQAWEVPQSAQLRVLEGGNINRTYLVAAVEHFALQFVHPVFGPAVHEDIDALTRHLTAKGVPTPRLVPTKSGELCVAERKGCWRLMTWLHGDTVHHISTPAQAAIAGQVVARFHAALDDFDWQYKFTRSGVHDTPKHLQKLQHALQDCQSHTLYNDVLALADELFTESSSLADFSKLPLRHCHGDLKISNILFAKLAESSALIDLDTVGRLQWPIEMGDAFRSWCNPNREDAPDVTFDLGIFEAGLSGYAESARSMWTKDERALLFEGVRTIPLELAARFLVDALREDYFGWDAARFASRGHHNLVRGRGQWRLYRDIMSKADQIQAIVQRTMGS